MGIFSRSKEIFAAEKKKQDAAKKAKRPLAVSIRGWILRLFYTVFMLLFVYTVILACTLSIPQVMSQIIASFGYNLNSITEIILALFSGLFFTAWAFALSFFAVKKAFGVYVNSMRNAMPDTAMPISPRQG